MSFRAYLARLAAHHAVPPGASPAVVFKEAGQTWQQRLLTNGDPDAGVASPTDVTAHLYFFMVKARRTADKERIIFWLNVSSEVRARVYIV